MTARSSESEIPDDDPEPGPGTGGVPGAAHQAGALAPSSAGHRRRACLELASVAAAIFAVTAYVQLGPRSGSREPSPAAGEPKSSPTPPAPAPEKDPPIASPAVAVTAPVAAPAAAPPVLDRVRIGAADKALEAATADRARADGRAANAARQLADAANRAAVDALRARKLAFQVRDPSNRIAQAVARGGFIRGERDKLAKEVATLRSAPRPKSISILSKSPVARPVADDEYHFELRRNRITYIDLDKLMQLTKADAQMRVRMSDRVGVVGSKVGPVGAFSLAYELAPTVPADLDGLIERRAVRRYELRGWELIPESDLRGETYEGTRNPISDFTRAVNRINPDRATVTLWIYPDSFGLYRRIRSDLVERGFSVAARPLPAGLGIRGSPLGSQSAAQ